jgi:lipopolysaccharide transport system ATP-binding protein
MSSDHAVIVNDVSKIYPIFKQPADRLKQMVVPRARRAIGLDAPAYFREFWALRDISFNVGRGETVGIVGRNGSGKSTLLQIVCGTLTASAGTIAVNGRLSALLELGTGFNPDFTGRENVVLNGQLKGFTHRQMLDRFEEIAAFADIGDFIEQPVKTYSSGMLVRLAFAVHAILDPDVLIVDEALAVGDARFQVKCFDRLAELKDKGTSILFVSHDVGAVRRFCERAIWLDAGRIVEQGDAYEVSSAFTEFMLGGGAAPNRGARAADIAAKAKPETVVAAADSQTAKKRPFSERFPYPTETQSPLRRWGSDVGLIVSLALTDADETTIQEIQTGRDIYVHIVADLPEHLQSEGLSIGFGIRSVAGHDLLIRSTFDAVDGTQIRQGARNHVIFKIPNTLGAGDYRLAATVEDRSGTNPKYYDFIEGALYFKITSPKYQWGIVVPDIPTSVTIE